MKILFSINHPAQFHLFNHPSQKLKENGHDVILVIRDKDILEDLMISYKIDYIRLSRKRIGKTRLSILLTGLLDLITHELSMFSFIRKFEPDLMVGTDYSISHCGKLLNIPAIVFNEDDFDINKFFCQLAYPFAKAIIAPTVCNVGKYDYKRIKYDGYQKLSYLHPSLFKPNRTVVSKYFPLNENYFLIRLVNFAAAHDIEMNHGGFQNHHLHELIKILSPYGRVFITSESKIPHEFEDYMLKIDYKDIHHIMYYSSLFIADSQSMIVEAAMLGTPNIRFNSFVGKISVLEELEHRYGLSYGISNKQPDMLLQKVREFVMNKKLKEEFLEKRRKMLLEKINVNEFIIWLIENYPESLNLIKKNPSYINRFK